MLKNYYSILEVEETSTQEEIKSAFKEQALKWHPDRNKGKDTTNKMQEINEAYLILKDEDARKRYNVEFQNFKKYKWQKEREYEEKQRRKTENKKEAEEKTQNEYSAYNVKDEILKKWMDNAKKQAVDLAKQTISDLSGMVVTGTKAAFQETRSHFFAYLISAGVMFLLIFFVKFCRH